MKGLFLMLGSVYVVWEPGTVVWARGLVVFGAVSGWCVDMA